MIIRSQYLTKSNNYSALDSKVLAKFLHKHLWGYASNISIFKISNVEIPSRLWREQSRKNGGFL